MLSLRILFFTSCIFCREKVLQAAHLPIYDSKTYLTGRTCTGRQNASLYPPAKSFNPALVRKINFIALPKHMHAYFIRVGDKNQLSRRVASRRCLRNYPRNERSKNARACPSSYTFPRAHFYDLPFAPASSFQRAKTTTAFSAARLHCHDAVAYSIEETLKFEGAILVARAAVVFFRCRRGS